MEGGIGDGRGLSPINIRDQITYLLLNLKTYSLSDLPSGVAF
jgi:hypothetical protein